MKRGCLLIHGFGGNPQDIAPLQKHLRKHTDWKIKTITLAGHGKSLNMKKTTRRDWLNDCLKSYDDLRKNCTVVDVIGFSMGSLLAIHLAGYRDVNRLVLLAPAVQMTSISQLFAVSKRLIKRLIKSYKEPILAYRIMKWRFPKIPLRSYIELKLLLNQAKSFLPQIDIPVFIALGKYDELIFYKEAAQWYDMLNVPEKEFILFGESGHFICWDQNKDTLHKIVCNFLQKQVTR